MGLIIVVSIEGVSCDDLAEAAHAAALMRTLANEVARIPNLEPGQSVRINPQEGVVAVAAGTQA